MRFEVKGHGWAGRGRPPLWLFHAEKIKQCITYAGHGELRETQALENAMILSAVIADTLTDGFLFNA